MLSDLAFSLILNFTGFALRSDFVVLALHRLCESLRYGGVTGEVSLMLFVRLTTPLQEMLGYAEALRSVVPRACRGSYVQLLLGLFSY